MSNPQTTPIDNLADWVTAYQQACAHRDQWAEVADTAKKNITGAIENSGAEIGTVNGHPAVRWTPVTTRRIDSKRLRAEHPDLVAEFTVTTHTRRFTLVEAT